MTPKVFLEADLQPHILELIMPKASLSSDPTDFAKIVIKHKDYPVETLVEMYDSTGERSLSAKYSNMYSLIFIFLIFMSGIVNIDVFNA